MPKIESFLLFFCTLVMVLHYVPVITLNFILRYNSLVLGPL